jgi:hypothetical protein
LRWIETIVAAAADGLKPSLVAQLKLIAGDLKRLGASDHHASHAMKALIEEIREACRDRCSCRAPLRHHGPGPGIGPHAHL